MSNPAQDQLFDYDLTERLRSRGAPSLDLFRVDDILPIVTVPATGGRGLMGLDRTLLGRGSDGDDLIPVSGYSTPILVEGASGTSVAYRTGLVSTRSYAVDRTAAAQSREDKRLKQGKRALQDAARGLFRIVSNLFVAGNFSGRTAALAAVSGGDGKNLTDASCDIIKNLQAAKRVFRSGNDYQGPNRLVMSFEDLETMTEVNTTIRKAIRDTADGFATTQGVRRLLKAVLGVDIVVKRAPAGSATNLWTGKMAYICVPEGTYVEPYEEATASPGGMWQFPGMDLKPVDPGDIEFGELTTAALVLQEFDESVIPVMTNGNPQTWGVATFMERFREELTVALAPAANILDANAGYLITATNG